MDEDEYRSLLRRAAGALRDVDRAAAGARELAAEIDEKLDDEERRHEQRGDRNNGEGIPNGNG